MSRNPVPAFADRRGPDGADGGAAVCPVQVMKQKAALMNLNEDFIYSNTTILIVIRLFHFVQRSLTLTTSRYTSEQQEALVSNVFVTGGNMQYPGMKERIERELLAMRPFQSHFKVLPKKIKNNPFKTVMTVFQNVVSVCCCA